MDNQAKSSDYISFSGKGVDVASHRADDLDKKCLAHVVQKATAVVLDLGSGAGGQAVSLVQTGATVVAVDSHDFSEVYRDIRSKHNFKSTQLFFYQEAIQSVSHFLQNVPITDVLFQRALHYLTYQEAKELLEYLFVKTTDSLFISVTGLQSAIGDGYSDVDKAIEDRYCTLSPLQSELFSISEPVCLYTKDELVTLLEKCGWTVDECWESAFGNIKAVCSHN